MEITYLIIGCLIGGILGSLIIYFYLKSSMVSRSSYDELNYLNIKSKADAENSNLKIQELENSLKKEKELNLQQSDLLNDLKNEFSKISAENTYLRTQFDDQKFLNQKQNTQIESILTEKQY